MRINVRIANTRGNIRAAVSIAKADFRPVVKLLVDTHGDAVAVRVKTAGF